MNQLNPGDPLYLVPPSELRLGTMLRRLNDGAVVIADTYGIEWVAESSIVYRLIKPYTQQLEEREENYVSPSTI
jgi:hypothetical protein